MNIRIRLGMTSFLLMSVLCLPAQHKWTLDECIDYAMEHNIDILQRDLNITKQQVSLESSKSQRLPDLSLQLGEQVSFGNYNLATGYVEDEIKDENRDLSYTTARLAITMPIFNGFKVKNSVKADEFALQSATANLENARKDMKINVAVYYLECLYYKSMADVAYAQVGVSRKLLERATALVEEGKRPRSEQAEAESQLSNDEYLLTDAKGQAMLALLSLSQLLNLETSEDFDVADMDNEGNIVLPLSPEVVYDGVSETYPSIVEAKALIEASRSQVQVARSGLYPSVMFQGYIGAFYPAFFGKEIGGDKSNFSFFRNLMNEVVGLHVAIPLIYKRTRSNIRSANLDVRYREMMLDDARQNLRKDIETAYYNANVAKDKYEAAEKSVIASRITVGYEEERYDAGRSNIFDLQQAQQKSLQAQQNAVRAKYEYLVRKRILDVYME